MKYPLHVVHSAVYTETVIMKLDMTYPKLFTNCWTYMFENNFFLKTSI